jgi:hypothetical protein
MKRRTLLQWIAGVAAILPFDRVRLFAQPRALTPQAIATLQEIAPTVLPSALGPARVRALVDKFVAWTRGYREGVALAHGYGHPRLQKTGPSPVPRYNAQLAELRAAAHSLIYHVDVSARPDPLGFSALSPDARRTLLESAFEKAGVRTLPPRPTGQHIVADLMAFYFRSSEANDDCYNAIINREVCRPIAITVRKPDRKA